MKDLGTRTLETKRLILRKYKLEDVEELFYNGYITDEVMAENMSWTPCKTLEDQYKVIEKWVEQYKNDDYYRWLIVLKETNEFIGGINVVNLYKRKNYGEVGYCIWSKYWNQGYATEALRRVEEYLLIDCDFHLVEAHHAGYNPASGRVMQKEGMKKDGELRERRLDKKTGIYTPQIYYSILKSEL